MGKSLDKLKRNFLVSQDSGFQILQVSLTTHAIWCRKGVYRSIDLSDFNSLNITVMTHGLHLLLESLPTAINNANDFDIKKNQTNVKKGHNDKELGISSMCR